jgi:putative FmdB family regulatory protein
VPTYEYRCENGHNFDVVQSMADPAVTECEVCGAPVQRVFHAPAVHFKGKGFYNTDYGTRNRQRENAAESKAKKESQKSESKSGSDGSSSSDSSSKSSDSSSSGSSSSSSSGDSGSGKASETPKKASKTES